MIFVVTEETQDIYMKYIWNTIIAITLIFAAFTVPQKVSASEKEAGATATLSANIMKQSYEFDDRVEHLRSYLDSKNSPMTATARHMVAEADRLGLDWKLIAAIAGVESYFGVHIPTDSYNAWGWAIFTGMKDGRHFEGWENGISQVSEGIRNNYVNRGLDTVEKIGPVYAADPGWSWKVTHFINEIEAYTPNKSDQLAIAL